ncbi:hypothetical protein ABID08_005473 [Rhizobium binae]|uniref:ROK family protein n=1 Tax=Rhizobium binae TaxID=1138190 RepID=A0ABV2MNQ9_9HYPH
MAAPGADLGQGGVGVDLDAWLDQAVQPLRQTLDFLELAFDPQTIVLGGSLSTSLMRRLAERLEPLHVPIDPNRKGSLPRVMIGMTGKDTAVLGAAALPIFSETNRASVAAYSNRMMLAGVGGIGLTVTPARPACLAISVRSLCV